MKAKYSNLPELFYNTLYATILTIQKYHIIPVIRIYPFIWCIDKPATIEEDLHKILINYCLCTNTGHSYFNFKLYLFQNNNTQLLIGQIGVILLGGESIRNIFGLRKPFEFLPWIKNLLMPAVGFEPSSSQSLSGGFHTQVSPPP